MQTEFDIETDYETVVSNGQVLSKRSRHNEDTGTNCNCDFDAPQGNYRDVTVKYKGLKYHFYHSTAVVIELGDNKYRLTSSGWKTKSTKERINRYLPGSSHTVKSVDEEWVIKTEGDTMPFKDGMVIEI